MMITYYKYNMHLSLGHFYKQKFLLLFMCVYMYIYMLRLE